MHSGTMHKDIGQKQQHLKVETQIERSVLQVRLFTQLNPRPGKVAGESDAVDEEAGMGDKDEEICAFRDFAAYMAAPTTLAVAPGRADLATPSLTTSGDVRN
jgi:hypothetical protein